MNFRRVSLARTLLNDDVRGPAADIQNTILEDIYIYGIRNLESVDGVAINGHSTSFSKDLTKNILSVVGVNQNLTEDFELTWKSAIRGNKLLKKHVSNFDS